MGRETGGIRGKGFARYTGKVVELGINALTLADLECSRRNWITKIGLADV